MEQYVNDRPYVASSFLSVAIAEVFGSAVAGRSKEREFQAWANRIGERFGYRVRMLPVGPEDAEVGAPTQMGVFRSR